MKLIRILFIVAQFLLFTGLMNGQNKPFPSELMAVGGWAATNTVNSFDAQTLYDHINGASDFYLSYHFKQLWVVEYANAQTQMLTLEIYEHANANCAFGIYVEERPANIDGLPVGAQGFFADGALYFLTGNYYVKIFSGNPTPEFNDLKKFAIEVAVFLSDENIMPSQLGWFPAQNAVASSERFTAENFLGKDGFNNVFTKSFKDGGVVYKMFVVAGTSSEAENVLNALLSANGVKRNANDTYLIKDKYNGLIYVKYKDGVMAGIVEHPKPAKFAVVVDQLISKSQ